MTDRERYVLAGLRGPSGEVLRVIAAQPVRGGTSKVAAHASTVLIPVARSVRAEE